MTNSPTPVRKRRRRKEEGLRLGAVLAVTIPVLTAAYRTGEQLTVGDIERRIDVPTTGVRRAIARLGRAFVPDVETPGELKHVALLEFSHRDGVTWKDKEGNLQPVSFIRLTKSGYAWAIETVESYPQGTKARKSAMARLIVAPC